MAGRVSNSGASGLENSYSLPTGAASPSEGTLNYEVFHCEDGEELVYHPAHELTQSNEPPPLPEEVGSNEDTIDLKDLSSTHQYALVPGVHGQAKLYVNAIHRCPHKRGVNGQAGATQGLDAMVSNREHLRQVEFASGTLNFGIGINSSPPAPSF